MDSKQERLSGAMQENVLTLLCFDDARSKLIRHAVQANTFESTVFRDIASQAIGFIDQYGSSIGEHLPDTLEHVLKGDDARKATIYKKTLENLFLAKESINGDYVLQQLHKFVRQQNMKSAILKAVEYIEDGKVDDAEVALETGLKSQIVTFEPGTALGKPDESLRFLDNVDNSGFFSNITQLDEADCMARRKELLMLLAPRGRGKSWFLVHMAKMAMLQRARVVIFSLEMSEERYAQRLLQSLWSVSKRDPQVRVPVLNKDGDGFLSSVDHEELVRQTLTDPNIRPYLAQKIRREFKRRPPLFIKEFATGSLTINMMEAYLEGLERFHKFIPDMIIVDYPDLMDLDSKNLRVETGRMYAALRGMAVKRNAAMVVASQGNRESESARTVTGGMASEDISKLAIVDTCITYSQTPAEKQLGLARLLVEKNRNDTDKFQVLISQAYQMGQFCLDSVRMGGDYWDLVEPSDRHRDEED